MKRILLLVICALLLGTGFTVCVGAEDDIDFFNVDYADQIGSDAGIASGYYYLYPKCAPKRVAAIADGSKKDGANAHIYKYSGADKQLFYIGANGDGTYTLKNKRSGKVLEAKDGGTSNKTNVQQGTYDEEAHQKWFITKKGKYYVFQNAASKKVMTVKGSKNANKANLYLYSYTASSGQKFTLKAKGGKTIVRKYKVSARKWDDTRDYDILTNIVGAVESGGQVYGNRNYAAYEGPYSNSPNEVTITIGWAQYYGVEAQKLVQNIYKKNPTKFKKIDTKKKVIKALKKDWVATHYNPSAAVKKLIIKLIQTDIGKQCQDELFKSYMVGFVDDCKKKYTDNAWAIHMYCQIRHLGGPSAADRIFKRCKGDYTLDSIMASLRSDQSDGASSYQVGDSVFWSRHVKCCEFLEKYAM